jgi:hypothetical protein
VPLAVAQTLVRRHHYSGGGSNTAACCHGLFRLDEPDECLGAAWWLPPIRAAAAAVCPSCPGRVLALSRLVVVPGVPANAFSFLLRHSMRQIDRKVWPWLVSYAGPQSGKKDMVALDLARGRNIRECADAHGLSESTVWRWLHREPAFSERVLELRSQLFGIALGELAEGARDAARTLKGLLQSKTETVRLQAARSILEYGPKLRETEELAAAVQNMQAQLAAMEDSVNGAAAGRDDLPGKELPGVGADVEVAGGAEPGPVAAGFAAREGADEAPRPLFSP